MKLVAGFLGLVPPVKMAPFNLENFLFRCLSIPGFLGFPIRLKVFQFFTLEDVKEKLERWKQKLNLERLKRPAQGSSPAVYVVKLGQTNNQTTTEESGELLEALI